MDVIFRSARTEAQAARDVRTAAQHAKICTRAHPSYCVGDRVWLTSIIVSDIDAADYSISLGPF